MNFIITTPSHEKSIQRTDYIPIEEQRENFSSNLTPTIDPSTRKMGLHAWNETVHNIKVDPKEFQRKKTIKTHNKKSRMSSFLQKEEQKSLN